MFSPDTRLVVTVAWIALAMLASWAMDASSGVSLVLLAIAAILPPVTMLALWNDGPPPTVAEVLYEVERKR